MERFRRLVRGSGGVSSTRVEKDKSFTGLFLSRVGLSGGGVLVVAMSMTTSREGVGGGMLGRGGARMGRGE